MIFIDSNIPMYLIGAPHPHKIDAQRMLEKCILERQRLVTDVEVLQEILHRYVAIDRRDAIQPAFDALLGVVDEIFPIDVSVVERAKKLVLSRKRISARDALHYAIMQQQDVKEIMTFDTVFDDFSGIKRIV